MGKNGWKNSTGEPVKNMELWSQLDELCCIAIYHGNGFVVIMIIQEMKWVFMLIREITEVKIEVDSKVIIKISNLDEVKDKIIRLMGNNCEKYYL